MAKSADSKLPALKGEEASNTLFEYLRAQNRPLNEKMIYENLHGRISKPEIVRSLGPLVESGEVTKKTYGKQSIYWYAQSHYEEVDAEQLAALDYELEQAEAEQAEAESTLREARHERESLALTPTTDALVERRRELERQCSALDDELERYRRSGIEPIDRDQYETRNRRLEEVERQAAKRRRLLRQVLGTLEEQVEDMSRQQLYDCIGIEVE